MKVFILSATGKEMNGFVATNDWWSTKNMEAVKVLTVKGTIKVCKNGSNEDYGDAAFESNFERSVFREAVLV